VHGWVDTLPECATAGAHQLVAHLVCPIVAMHVGALPRENGKSPPALCYVSCFRTRSQHPAVKHELNLHSSLIPMQCAPVKALVKSCTSKAGPTALMDQLCSELLAPANATADSKVRILARMHARTCTHARAQMRAHTHTHANTHACTHTENNACA
jgi:hypothetical protein